MSIVDFVPKIKGSLKPLVVKLKNSQAYYFFLIWRPILWCVTPIQNNITCNLSYSDSRKDFPGGSDSKCLPTMRETSFVQLYQKAIF